MIKFKYTLKLVDTVFRNRFGYNWDELYYGESNLLRLVHFHWVNPVHFNWVIQR